MSFFRNLRSSITRGRSASRDNTPAGSSRPGSIISSFNSGSSKRRDSIESHSDSLLNRSDTFILTEPAATTPCHSNSSTLEKKSKKSKVLEKFSTFTKRKKSPPSEAVALEHHPSDNATNTYYKWQAEGGGNSLDYDAQNDPFNFLYEQQYSLKSSQNSGDSLKSRGSPASTSFDSSTYRKSKMPADLKKQLKMLNSENKVKKKVERCETQAAREDQQEAQEVDEEKNLEADKYKTVTLNSFRRSFREKFLQQQKETAHNPAAWFVQVEAETAAKNHNKNDQRDSSKENRRDLLVFENEYYKPGSRSPIRDINNRQDKTRSSARSPVKRNETFRIERLSRLDQQLNKSKLDDNTGSIHIEIKNSISPHMPGRLVPVGVAKPMPSQFTYTNYYRKMEPTNHNHTSSTRLINHSPTRSAALANSQSPTRTANSQPTRVARYQTLVQIRNEKCLQDSPITVRNSRLSTHIQLGSGGYTNPEKKANPVPHSAPLGKRYNSSQTLGNSATKPQPFKQTYFGDTPPSARTIKAPANLTSSTSGLRTRQALATGCGGFKYHTPSLFASASSLIPAPTTRTTPSHSVNNIHTSISSSIRNSNNNNPSYYNHYQPKQQQQQQQPQLQTRFLVTGQRRSRSPIKAPWR